MSREKQIVKSTDWLIKGYSEEEIASKKAEAIEEAEKEIRNKQIEEMARDVCRVKQNCNDVCHPINSCRALKYAERFYDAGYRKQSEGKWEQESFKAKNGEILHHTPTCSICGKSNSFKTDYCPNCGASMKGGAE